MLIADNLNHYMEWAAYESFLTVQGLADFVIFPTHERGGTLDPVISNLHEGVISCTQLGPVGSSGHYSVFTKTHVRVM